MTAAPEPCPVDRKALLQLEFSAFDQDLEGGWRALYKRPECRKEAADVIRLYRQLNVEPRLTTLKWHEGQLRAEMGETEEAIALMASAKKEPFPHGQSQDDWNAYVDATIAFLRGERDQLLSARERLARFPLPDGYRYIDSEGALQAGRPPNWPPNLDVVDGLIRCFGRSYEEAYGAAHCRNAKAP